MNLPFGYRIHNAEVIVDPEEAEKLRLFFQRFMALGKIKTAAKEVGLKQAPRTCKRMLSNRIYLGEDDYPAIITPELFEEAQEMLRKIAQENKCGRRIPDLPVYTGFMLSAPEKRKAMSPKEYAVYQYGRIKAVW